MRPLSDADVQDSRDSGFGFPVNVVRLGYSTNLWTYGANTLFSQTIPIFWGGNVETRSGFTLDYQRNVFHTGRCSRSIGASASYWTSNGNETIFRTLSVYPLFRFFLVRSGPADVYFSYSLAGPTYISHTMIDGRDTGERFTFQDFMGVGSFIGEARRMNVEAGSKPSWTGNLLSSNASIKVPLTLTFGFTF
jgi:hypothetical protein